MSNVDISSEELDAMSVGELKRNLLWEIEAAAKRGAYASIHLDNIQMIREKLKSLGISDFDMDAWKPR